MNLNQVKLTTSTQGSFYRSISIPQLFLSGKFHFKLKVSHTPVIIHVKQYYAFLKSVYKHQQWSNCLQYLILEIFGKTLDSSRKHIQTLREQR